MKLKPNMYVRTKEGEIGKVISNETIEFQKDYAKIEYLVIGGEITKASHNIIDLIEEGDYVNGHKVYEIIHDVNSYVILEEVGCYVDTSEMIDEKGIKSIVTKEQFESMGYKVGSK